MFLFLSCFFLLDFLYLLASNTSDLLDDEFDDDESDFGCSGTYSFPAFSLKF